MLALIQMQSQSQSNIHTQAQTQTQLHIYRDKHRHTNIYIHTDTQTYTYTYTDMCVYVCVCLCMCEPGPSKQLKATPFRPRKQNVCKNIQKWSDYSRILIRVPDLEPFYRSAPYMGLQNPFSEGYPLSPCPARRTSGQGNSQVTHSF